MKQQRTWWQRTGYDVLRAPARLVGLLLFGIRCFGRENWPQEGGGLVCANHQSYLDPVLVGLSCDRRLNYLARATLFRFPLFRWLIEFLDAIPIEREGLGLEGIRETIRRVRAGEFVLLFPEGTRTSDGEVGPFKSGFCTLARRASAPLIPVGLDGAFQCWPRTQRFPLPGIIHIVIGRPIATEEIARLSDEQLIAELARRVNEAHLAARASRARGLGDRSSA